MREEAFRRFLAPRLGARSVDSYLSNQRRVERVLSIDVDALAMDDQVIDTIRTRLRGSGTNDAKVSDCLSALRAYTAFQRGSAETPSPAPTVPATASVASTTPAPPPTGLAPVATAELLANYAAILRA